MELESFFTSVRRPGRYIGNEFNIAKKDWSRAVLRLVLVFPDLYEIGMSHHGLQILYHIINSRSEFLADRAYAPDTDFESLLRRQGQKIFSLEHRRSLGDFDVIGITLPYELCYTNILTILDLAGLPLRAADRDDSQPLVIGGGSGSLNPEPVADFFDAILLGDGEEAILELADVIRDAKSVGLNRSETLHRLAVIDGVYVPSFFRPEYDGNGVLQEVRPLKDGYERVRRRIVSDLENVPHPYPPLVPLIKIVHDRLGVEIARGCTRGCRFCQAGIIYRPVRERSPAKVVEAAMAGLEAGGFEELALLSLSTGDYGCLSMLMKSLMDAVAGRHVSISMPSMRVGTLTREVMDQIKRVRKTGFTVAPEAGSDRLRRVINKGITEDDLLETCRSAFGLGWKLIKFYFMFGLPTETQDDIKAIPELARRALKMAGGGGCQINVSVATFVPKPHTPFQWERQLSIEEGFERVDFLKKSLPRHGFKLKWHDPRQSFMEGVLSRGDRRLSALLEAVWKRGARLEGWSEHYDLKVWQEAAISCGLDLDSYLRRREFDEVLPWRHLDPGVDEEFLRSERAKALTEEYTPDCRVHGCQKCGLCDFKKIKPIVFRPEDEDSCKVGGPATESLEDRLTAEVSDVKVQHFVYRLNYSRLDKIRFLGHLELMQVFFRAFRRVQLPLHYSQGFNPSPKVSFSPALPVGTESVAEYLDADLSESLTDPEALILELNRQLPAGLVINSIVAVRETGQRNGAVIRTCYKITLPDDFSVESIGEDLNRFLARQEFFLARTRKGRTKDMDVRPLVEELSVGNENSIALILLSEPGQAGIKPLELLEAVLSLPGGENLPARITKLWWRES